MTLEEYMKSKNGTNRNFKSLFFKVMFCIFILFVILSICKLSPDTRKLIKEELFQTNFNFAFVNGLISKILPNENVNPVNNEVIKYRSEEPYLNGVKIDTTSHEAINLIESGIVVFIGSKEGYGNTVIVQQSNGVDVWYGNVSNVSVNLYDYVNKNTVIAEANEELFLVFQKNGEFLDYQNFI